MLSEIDTNVDEVAVRVPDSIFLRSAKHSDESLDGTQGGREDALEADCALFSSISFQFHTRLSVVNNVCLSRGQGAGHHGGRELARPPAVLLGISRS